MLEIHPALDSCKSINLRADSHVSRATGLRCVRARTTDVVLALTRGSGLVHSVRDVFVHEFHTAITKRELRSARMTARETAGRGITLGAMLKTAEPYGSVHRVFRAPQAIDVSP